MIMRDISQSNLSLVHDKYLSLEEEYSALIHSM